MAAAPYSTLNDSRSKFLSVDLYKHKRTAALSSTPPVTDARDDDARTRLKQNARMAPR